MLPTVDTAYTAPAVLAIRSVTVRRTTMGDTAASRMEGTPSSTALAATAPQAGPQARSPGRNAGANHGTRSTKAVETTSADVRNWTAWGPSPTRPPSQ